MTTKGLSRKQVIVHGNNDNKKNFMKESSVHISNMNRALENIKTDIMVNFVWSNLRDIIIMTNKVTSSLDLQMIKNYVKNTNYISTDKVEVPRLPQSKSCLKIIGIPYLQENMVTFTTLSMVKDVIKKNHIFNNIILIYVLSKSPPSQIWLLFG